MTSMRSSSGAGNRVRRVRRADEQHLRQVERQVEIVIAERRVLLGVEHLEQRRGGVAAEVRAELVDLVEHQHRVRRLRVAKRADDRARHRADVRAPVTAHLRLVAHAAEAPSARSCVPARAQSTCPSDVLPTPGGPTKQRIGPVRVVTELRDREVLDDAVLHLLKAVVILVEHRARMREIEVVGRRRTPGQASRSSRGTCG